MRIDLMSGYRVEVDSVNEESWYRILGMFYDANIYQTWSYGALRFGSDSLSHLVLKKDDRIVAAAQVIIKAVPVLNAGIAYLYWGPLWHARDAPEDSDVFSQVLRALRNEYASRRGLVMRVLPVLYDNAPGIFPVALVQEGFENIPHGRRQRTLLIDLSMSLEDLRKGFNQKWRNCLNRAERNGLEILEGDNDELFGKFAAIYREMHSRKNFAATSDVNEFRQIQESLPKKFKMKIMICLQAGEPAAGGIFSAIGTTGVYMFGATGSKGMNSNGSYLIQWKAIEWLKNANCCRYDLHGIDPVKNPGTYKFKAGLCGNNGHEVQFLGQFDAHDSLLSFFSVRCGDALKVQQKKIKNVLNRLGAVGRQH